MATPTVGYVITFPVQFTAAQLATFIATLSQIRPVGVPFEILYSGGGVYFDTFSYIGGQNAAGAYLEAVGQVQSNAIVPYLTTNAIPLVPDLLLVDPVLNPSYAAAGTTVPSEFVAI